MYRKLGILGGMGPLSTCRLYELIINGTAVQNDQDHIDMIILNAAHIPDRTAGILGMGESPLPALLKERNTLIKADCDLIAIPCNTSHYYFAELTDGCSADILNMAELTALEIQKCGFKKIFVAATEGTVKGRIYGKYLMQCGVEAIYPNQPDTTLLMRVIYDIKAGKTADVPALAEILERYSDGGADAVILGCTELSVIYEQIKSACPKIEIIDAMRVLSNEILRLFGKI